MQGAKITVPNGRRFAVVARSGSYSICWQSLPESLQHRPDDAVRWHPISVSPTRDALLNDEVPDGLCCMVRDPVERFRSSCARQGVSVEEGLELILLDGHFWSLDSMGLLTPGVMHFRFPDQLDTCAEWLGLETPVPQLNEEADEAKPVLTAAQEARIKEIYAADIALWESLQS